MENISVKQKLDGKVAIITGGASGIGEATAHHFAMHGARAVVIADIQDDKGRAVAEAIGSGRCRYVNYDVTDEEQVKSLVDWTVKTYGGIDIMFSNAGILEKKFFDCVMWVNMLLGKNWTLDILEKKFFDPGCVGAGAIGEFAAWKAWDKG